MFHQGRAQQVLAEDTHVSGHGITFRFSMGRAAVQTGQHGNMRSKFPARPYDPAKKLAQPLTPGRIEENNTI